MTRVWLALGSNLGDRAAHIAAGVAALGALPGTRLTAVSEVIETPPVGGPDDQGPFLNAAVGVETALSGPELLDATQRIELNRGREPLSRREHWGPRPLDIDLLLFGDAVIDEPGLKVPHPRMAEREFVLEPLAQIAADVVHPVDGRTVAELLAALAEHATP